MADFTIRKALLLALGVPANEADSSLVLAIAFGTLKAEAELLVSEDSTLDERTRFSLEYAHRHRIEALRLLVDEHLSVNWKEAANG